MKQLSRELENNLRAAEILFTVTYQSAQQKGDATAVTHFSDAYYELVQVRGLTTWVCYLPPRLSVKFCETGYIL